MKKFFFILFFLMTIPSFVFAQSIPLQTGSSGLGPAPGVMSSPIPSSSGGSGGAAGAVSGAINAATDLLSVPVNDAQLREDVRLFRLKSIGTGGSPQDAIKKTAGGITKVLGDIASKLPSLNLPTIPIPKIGGIDIGSWAKSAINLFNSIKSSPAWDSLTVTLVRLATDKIFDDMTDWVNRGFNGNPAFATNLNDWLKKSSDSVLGQALNEITNGFACQPFRLELNAAITRDFGISNRGRYFQNSCNLSDIQGNVNNFLKGDFSQGGWPAWFRITQVDQNNPYGEYLEAVNITSLNIQGARNVEVTKLNWSAGFFGTRKCIAKPQIAGPVQAAPPNPDGSPGTVSLSSTIDDPDPNHCLVWQETTPGHLLADQVSKVTGTAVDQVNLANRFDEFLGAVVNQLTNRIFSPRGFITNTGSKPYVPEPITGTVDYGGGSGTTASVGDCSVDNTSAVIGDTVNWSVNFSAGDNSSAQFIWSGDEVVSTSTTNATLPVTYQSAGVKNMNVSVNYQEADLSSFDPSTQTYTKYTPVSKNLSCAQTVQVARYKPLAASCVADISHARAGKDMVVYTFTVSGGSGSFYSFTAEGNQYDKGFAGSQDFGFVYIKPGGSETDNSTWRGGISLDDKKCTGLCSITTAGIIGNYSGSRPAYLGIPQQPVVFSKDTSGMIIKVGKIYDHAEDPVGLNAKIIDADNTVPVVSGLSCGNVTITP